MKLDNISLDKVYHFAACFIFSAIVAMIVFAFTADHTCAFLCALLGGLAIGGAKELYDEFKGSGADIYDIFADLAGALLAALFSFGL